MINLLFVALARSAIDESQFSKGKFCQCAVIPGQCNPNCFCDPLCTDAQRETFTFALPEHPGDAKISCDPYNYISKVNSDSVQEITINGVKCYVVQEDPETMEKVKSYTPADFGLTDFNDFVTRPFIQDVMDKERYTYNNGEPIMFSGEPDRDGEFGAFFIPVAFGSRFCNYLLPLAYNRYFPYSRCRVKSSGTLQSYLGQHLADERDGTTFFATDPNRTVEALPVTVNTVTFPQHVQDMNFTIIGSGGHVSSIWKDIDAIVDREEAYDYEHYGSIIGCGVNNSRGVVAPGANNAGETSGYFIGGPIRLATSSSPTEKVRDYLTINNEQVKFGVSTTYIFQANEADFNEAFLGNRTTLWASFGNIVDSPGMDVGNIEIRPTFHEQQGSGSDVKVRWTFLYRKFGYHHKWIYLLVSADVDVILPAESGTSDTPVMVTVETVFTELTEDGSAAYIPPGEEQYTSSISMIFDVFFTRTSDTLKASGAIFGMTLLAIIWAYYAFIFENR